MDLVVKAIISFGVLSVVLGAVLVLFSKLFAAEIDERIDGITDMLPGANCGGCGFAGCAALAAAIVNGEAKPNACPVSDDKVAEAIAGLMGVETDKLVRYRAQVMCSGTNELAHNKYEYMGIMDCQAANRLSGGPKTCPNGCLGLGTCQRACAFDAIHIINGVAAVDYEKCKACGTCVAACPKDIIKLIPYDSVHWVGCMSHDKGALTRKYCDVGCLGCKLCEKACESGAMIITDSVATIDYSKCVGCNKCEEVCPRRVIWSGRSQSEHGLVRAGEHITDIPEDIISK